MCEQTPCPPVRFNRDVIFGWNGRSQPARIVDRYIDSELCSLLVRFVSCFVVAVTYCDLDLDCGKPGSEIHKK